jgi:hypothetical protein
MSSLLPFLIISSLLLLLLVWLLKARGEIRESTGYEEAEEALNTLRGELLPSGLVERILGPADFAFVANEGDAQIEQQLEEDRKRLAILWLRHTREQVERLFRFHLRFARQESNLSPAQEFQLAFTYFLFLLAYATFLNSIRLRGPLRVRRAVGFTTAVAERVCAASGNLFMKLKPARASAVQGPPTNLSSAS